ncbi:TetR/AcrR family transcriptional regulator [Protaetiibacter intestinalis]|uniref:TetR/AcrR family transcriptional regulator n=1 Tax=Protaetiibacter intestinalis TaxID=2419774 RepID=A0A387BCX7_9MICO|nr:TetR/AcrR family transcriptional regulator [Protaetiibacter intestinalis]
MRAATAEFLANGYDDTSLRAIARRAKVDPALVHHYFDDKSQLFMESFEAPLRPPQLVALALAGPREQVGATIVRGILEALSTPAAAARVRQLLRTALGHDFAGAALRQFLVREVLHRVASALEVPDAELRATLAATQIVGLIAVRYGIRVEPLASAPLDEVVRRIGPVVQWHLLGYGSVDTPEATGE